jgi:hypothetical protein
LNSLARRPLATNFGVLLFFLLIGATGGPELKAPVVPLVACSPEEATVKAAHPAGQSRPVPLDQQAASQLSYYRAADLPGVYAPKGWHCTVWNGTNGRILLVTPQRIPPPYFPLPVILGTAVMIQTTEGKSSGRFHVAIVAAELFPVVGRDFIKSVRQEHLISDSSFDAEHYPDDQLQYLSDRFVQYTTPPNRSGLGTEGILDMSDLPVRGLTILNPQNEVISLTEVRVRLPNELAPVAEMVLRLETACVQQGVC